MVRRDPDYGPGPWPSEPHGTVSGAGGPCYTLVETMRGSERSYWITFDEPQRDTDGDGPYESSQVLERYLQVLPSTNR